MLMPSWLSGLFATAPHGSLGAAAAPGGAGSVCTSLSEAGGWVFCLVVGRATSCRGGRVRHGRRASGRFCDGTRGEQVWIDGAVCERVDDVCLSGSECRSPERQSIAARIRDSEMYTWMNDVGTHVEAPLSDERRKENPAIIGLRQLSAA